MTLVVILLACMTTATLLYAAQVLAAFAAMNSDYEPGESPRP